MNNLYTLFGFSLLCFTVSLNAQVTTQWGPDGFVKIENGSGGFNAALDSGDRFSRDHDQAGDINGDGIIDLVIGARSDDDGARDAGAVYIAFMNNDGTVQSNQKISMLEGGFNETLNANNFFGYGVAGIGDYDNDGIPDIAASAPASTNRALYIIHLNRDGTVKNFVKNAGIIAQGLSAVGDLNNDGRIDLVACDPNSDDGGNNRGAINILFLDSSSQVIAESTVTISSTSGGFGVGLENNDRFGGREVAMLGDIDGDGTQEMAVGAFMSDGGKGAIWILSLDPSNYNVVSKLKITEGLNGFHDTLVTDANPNGSSGAQFGHAMCAAGDLNGDGIMDLITGANQQGLGDVYILYLNRDKTVKTYTKIDETEGGFNLEFDEGSQERFSRSISFIGDLRGDGTIAVNVGGGVGQAGTGTLYLLFFKPCNFNQEEGFNHWRGGNVLFTNWSHNTQMLTSDSLTLEQCSFKAFETDAPYMTYNFNDGRCICKDATATLATSTELSTAFSKDCTTNSLNSFFYLEAECALLGSAWETQTRDDASNKSYTVIPWQEQDNTLREPSEELMYQLRFDFEIEIKGEYHIYTRTQAGNQWHNSFWVRMDGGDWMDYENIKESPDFVWQAIHDSAKGDSIITFQLEAGMHFLDFSLQENASRLDKIYIVTANTLQPEGIGDEMECVGEENIAFQSHKTKAEFFPNPTNDWINIHFDNGQRKTLEIHSIKGELLSRIDVEDFQHQLDLSNYANGLYILSVIDATSVWQEQIVKQ